MPALPQTWAKWANFMACSSSLCHFGPPRMYYGAPFVQETSMSSQTDLVAKFLSSLQSGAATDLLAPDASFQALNVNLVGKDAVVERFTKSAAAGAYAEARWTQ